MNMNENGIASQSGTPQRWRVLISTFLAYFYDSLDFLILSISMPVIIKVLDISLAQGGLLASATMIGAAVGSIIMGLIAENKGRKFALILGLVWIGIGSGLVLIIDSYTHWMILRVITGIGLGGLMGPSTALISQHWNMKYRAKATSFMLSTFAIAGVAATLIGRIVLTVNYKILFIVGATSILIAIIAYFLLPPDEIPSVDKTAQKREKVKYSDIFNGPLKRITILATMLSFCMMAGNWTLNSWVPTYLVKVRGLSLESMANFSMLSFAGMFVGYQVCAYIADKIGRKKALMFCFIMGAVATVTYVLIPGKEILFWFGAIFYFAQAGLGGIMGSYFAEMYPAHLRALGGGSCFNWGRIGSVISPYTVGLIGGAFGLSWGLCVAAVLYLIGVFILVFMPETLVKQKDQIIEAKEVA